MTPNRFWLTADERAAESWELERRHLETELRDLRAQLGKSAAMVSEFSELRRELDKSEKQRNQLSDHIQVRAFYSLWVCLEGRTA